ncbi:hypothetical protein A2U01_0018378, partial [Trifolium medium]|nr:hypothetical protein [Trifolium medium]
MNSRLQRQSWRQFSMERIESGLVIDNNQRPRFPGKIEASANVMQGISFLDQFWMIADFSLRYKSTDSYIPSQNIPPAMLPF